MITTPQTETPAPFVIPAASYDRFIGRYVPTLAPAFADAAGIAPGMTALDVGSGPGGLTRELVRRLGADSVAAIDPSPPLVAACADRNPGVDVRTAPGPTRRSTRRSPASSSASCPKPPPESPRWPG